MKSEREKDRAAIVATDKKFVWHPYTQMRRYLAEVDPFVIHRASGARLFDLDGRSYLDANSSWYVATLGHKHPRLVAELARQAAEMPHVSLAGTTHAPAALLAEELVALAPRGLDKVFYSDDGSTAIEVALKLALQMNQNEGRMKRTRFVALDGAYHGDTLGASSLGGAELFRRPFASVMLECVHVPSPTDGRAYERAFAALAELVRREQDTIAAIVLEPLLQGTAGMRVYAPEYLRAARELCDETGVLLVLDEVLTGYGRTGTMWAAEQAGVSPDLMCLGKGFTGGLLPMAATLATLRVFEAFLGGPEKTFNYGHSFCGNPLGASLAREVLAIYRDERVIENAQKKAQKIARAFEAMGALPGVARWRSLGMTGALDLADDAGYTGTLGWRVFEEARRRGAYLRPLGDVVYVAPPINIPDADLDELLGIVDESVRVVTTGPRSSP